MHILVFILFDVLWAYWTCGLVSVIDYGKFSAFLASNFFPLFSLFSFSDILIMHMPYFLKFSYHSWMFWVFFFNYYYFFLLHFSLATFYWPLFKLADFCLGCTYSVDEPDLDIFHSLQCFCFLAFPLIL